MVKVGDVVQANEKTGIWTGSLLIVSEVKDWGVQAGLLIPGQGTAYMRLRHGEYERIGAAVLVPSDEDEDGGDE